MTVKTAGAAAGRPASRAPGRRPARAGTVEQLSRGERVARGKEARAAAPLARAIITGSAGLQFW
jgi:hypothetical protein